jgi:hypothetical protein
MKNTKTKAGTSSSRGRFPRSLAYFRAALSALGTSAGFLKRPTFSRPNDKPTKNTISRKQTIIAYLFLFHFLRSNKVCKIN